MICKVDVQETFKGRICDSTLMSIDEKAQITQSSILMQESEQYDVRSKPQWLSWLIKVWDRRATNGLMTALHAYLSILYSLLLSIVCLGIERSMDAGSHAGVWHDLCLENRSLTLLKFWQGFVWPSASPLHLHCISTASTLYVQCMSSAAGLRETNAWLRIPPSLIISSPDSSPAKPHTLENTIWSIQPIRLSPF